ncbi:hypothetical protein EV673_3170 [Limnobacter thiooxidans]|uniref:Glycosyltransferase family 1 protein n=1 Tax=Limnobacter thiooxidans TaxID=131080 RepID=A0AA86IXC3_9BURK|nr:hypothetical protein [Limnobacter sp.]MCZ8017057.1 hypothetical protein [Limnobacter sp.]RZS38777.1 hypothetical protein EV673_3170 [Limnobacter thiooxidans]BET24769.1 hypothetical protein RGQ30_02700 [Limnobacter thiooxidans]
MSTVNLNFVIPRHPHLSDLSVDEFSLNDFPYWLGGAVNWVLRAYVNLKENYPNSTVSYSLCESSINIIHVRTLRELGGKKGCYCVVIRADYRRLYDCDVEIVQNIRQANYSRKRFYITYWALPRIIKRVNRWPPRVIGYAGRLGPNNLDEKVVNYLNEQFGKLIEFRIIPNELWHDASDIDIYLAYRNRASRHSINKPPSKLINAWLSEVPLIAGMDIAYRDLGIHGADYLACDGVDQLISSVDRLLNDKEFYERIVRNGVLRSSAYSDTVITEEWIRVVQFAQSDYHNIKSKSKILKYLKCALMRSVDSFIDILYNFKEKISK